MFSIPLTSWFSWDFLTLYRGIFLIFFFLFRFRLLLIFMIFGPIGWQLLLIFMRFQGFTQEQTIALKTDTWGCCEETLHGSVQQHHLLVPIELQHYLNKSGHTGPLRSGDFDLSKDQGQGTLTFPRTKGFWPFQGLRPKGFDHKALSHSLLPSTVLYRWHPCP